MHIIYIMYNATRLEYSLFYSFSGRCDSGRCDSGRCDSGRIVDWFTINHNINVYYHLRYEWFYNTWLCAVDTTLHNTICQSFPAGQWFYPGTPVSCSFKRYARNIVLQWR
jgi:hypothetical protein